MAPATRNSRNLYQINRDHPFNGYANFRKKRIAARRKGQRAVSQMPLWDMHPVSVQLASRFEAWQRGQMTEKQQGSPQGAGSIIALLSITGVIAGGLAGQPTIGLLAGLGLGVGIGMAMWLRDRRH